MKSHFKNIDKAFENRVRLGIMSILIVSEWVAFQELKEKLGLTDGNLASHITYLEKTNYIEVKKEFEGKKPKTSYRITYNGKSAFIGHINALEAIIKGK